MTDQKPLPDRLNEAMSPPSVTALLEECRLTLEAILKIALDNTNSLACAEIAQLAVNGVTEGD